MAIFCMSVFNLNIMKTSDKAVSRWPKKCLIRELKLEFTGHYVKTLDLK